MNGVDTYVFSYFKVHQDENGSKT